VLGTIPEQVELPPNTRVVEWVDDIIETYQNSDVFVLPAIEDGCPLVTYEALACGLPVIISKTTGTKQHVWNGTNGFVIDSGNVSEIADRIKFLYEHRNELAEMKKKARESVMGLTWKSFEEQYAKWIQGILNGNF